MNAILSVLDAAYAAGASPLGATVLAAVVVALIVSLWHA